MCFVIVIKKKWGQETVVVDIFMHHCWVGSETGGGAERSEGEVWEPHITLTLN